MNTPKNKEFPRLLNQVPDLFRERNPDKIISWLLEARHLSDVLTNNAFSSILTNYIVMVQQLYDTWLKAFREGGILIESESSSTTPLFDHHAPYSEEERCGEDIGIVIERN